MCRSTADLIPHCRATCNSYKMLPYLFGCSILSQVLHKGLNPLARAFGLVVYHVDTPAGLTVRSDRGIVGRCRRRRHYAAGSGR